MDKQRMLALFVLAGIAVKHAEELPNGYWPNVPAYDEARRESPWWLAMTEFGPVKIGWRKRVISIDWSATEVRSIITEDDTTKAADYVHAWTYAKAVEYLTNFAQEARRG